MKNNIYFAFGTGKEYNQAIITVEFNYLTFIFRMF